MIEKLRHRVAPWYKNLRGWKTGRKIVVIESDDWGSIRMPSRDVYETCLKAGYRVDRTVYEKYDSLASNEDLELLFDLLRGFKDINGNHPVITANALTSNPDFERIKESDFSEYFFEPITETFKKYPNHGNVFNLWQKGIKEGVFFPQSHGREHLNVAQFMGALKNRDKDVMFAFNHEMPGSLSKGNETAGNTYTEALNYSDADDKQDKLKIIIEGLDLFESLFGYRSESFIAPTYLWSPDYDGPVSQSGVKFYQGNRRMKEPVLNGEGVKMHTRKLGEKNEHGQRYLVRNATFEPSLHKDNASDPVGQCLRQVRVAFRMKKPAVLCSHRINYVGCLDPKNRDRTLRLLDKLLKEILREWPEAEFMTSPDVGHLLEKND